MADEISRILSIDVGGIGDIGKSRGNDFRSAESSEGRYRESRVATCSDFSPCEYLS